MAKLCGTRTTTGRGNPLNILTNMYWTTSFTRMGGETFPSSLRVTAVYGGYGPIGPYYT